MTLFDLGYTVGFGNSQTDEKDRRSERYVFNMTAVEKRKFKAICTALEITASDFMREAVNERLSTLGIDADDY